MISPKTDNDLWIRNYHQAPSGAPRLVCLPHAGGSATFYFPVSRALSPAIEVMAIQYPGRQERRHEALVDNLQDLAALVFEALSPWPSQPVAIFGHSMGASLGFELARLAEQQAGATLSRLFVSGRRAPSRLRHETVHLRDDEGLLADLRQLSGTDDRILGDEEMLRLTLPAIRSDYKAAETYTYEPGPKLNCPITAFTGDNDPKATVDEVSAWAEHTVSDFDLSVFPGGHFFLAKHQQAVLKSISEKLAA